MLLFPHPTLQGTKSGLLLWYQYFLPAVYPFMILSGLFIRYLKKGGYLFAVCAGFLTGFPNGAKTAANLYEKGLLPKNMASLCAVFCNLASPMFMSGYAGLRQELPLIYLTSAILLFFCLKLSKNQEFSLSGNACRIQISSIDSNVEHTTSSDSSSGDFLMECTAILVKAGIYIMFFSILIEFLKFPVFSWKPLQLITPFLEMTTGIAQVNGTDFPLPQLRKYFSIFICVSGGLCTAFQTQEVTQALNLSLPRYLIMKILHGIIVCFICYLANSSSFLFVNLL